MIRKDLEPTYENKAGSTWKQTEGQAWFRDRQCGVPFSFLPFRDGPG